jgi:hypothetical protein
VRFLRFAAASAAAALVLISTTPPAGAVGPPPAARVAAAYGGGWLARLITMTGGYVPTDVTKPATSAPDASGTAGAVLALYAAGVGSAAASTGAGWLQAHAQPYTLNSSGDLPGLLAELILVAHAAGVDPRAFGAEGDLVARLEASRQPSGLFGKQDPTYDGAFRQGLGLLALSAVGVPDRLAERWLLGQQCADGGWMAFRKDISVPCLPPNPGAFTGPDTNSTSLAMEGLAAAHVRPTHDVTAFLQSAQEADGGFAYIPGGAKSDPNSTAVVIQALIAQGQDPASWAKGGHTPYDGLLGFALGCAAPAPDRGAFWFETGDGSRSPNALATLQVPAAAGVAFPLPPSEPAATVPTLPCAAPASSPSPRAAPSLSSPSAAPTPPVTDTLPFTGIDGTGLALSAVLAIALGVGLLSASRGGRDAR